MEQFNFLGITFNNILTVVLIKDKLSRTQESLEGFNINCIAGDFHNNIAFVFVFLFLLHLSPHCNILIKRWPKKNMYLYHAYVL